MALEWDNVGLQLGSPQEKTQKILVALDVNELVLNEAIDSGADLIVSHHPLIFRPLPALRTDLYEGRILAKALSAGIRIFAAHTNLDMAAGGVNDALAKCLGLQEPEVLRVSEHENLEKIVVYIPQGFEDKIRDAMNCAGAGWIGSYSHCSFQTPGTSTFLPGEGTQPFIGSHGKLERVDEIRLETIAASSVRSSVIKAMLDAHPYEEVAYDIYSLENKGKPIGLGRIGTNPFPCTLAEYCMLVKEKLKVSHLRVVGDESQIIKKVAVCGGAGTDLIAEASLKHADVLVTGDLKYHEAQNANSAGLAIIDAGHDATEKVIIPVLCSYLKEKISLGGFSTTVIPSITETIPWRFL